MHETEYIRKYIRPYLEKELGALVIKHYGSPLSQAGVSDLLCCIDGEFCAFEVKKPKGKLTKIQEKFIHNVLYHGGKAGVIHTDTFKEDLLEISPTFKPLHLGK